MLVAKCSSCKNKTELQACEVCEEAKCVKCAQQHLAEHRASLMHKWKSIEARVNQIRQQTNKRQAVLVGFQHEIDKQLSNLNHEYSSLLTRLMKQKQEFEQQMSASKVPCQKTLDQLKNQWNGLETDTLFQKWTATTDSTRYLFEGDSSSIENTIIEIESCLREAAEYNLEKFAFIPNKNATLGALKHLPRSDASV